MSTGDDVLNAKSVEALLYYYVNMEDNVFDARSAVALLFVNMGEYSLNSKSAEALLFVSMGETALNAKSAGKPVLFVNCH